MLLSYCEILELLEANVVQGARPENVNGSSLDITLGNEVLSEQCPPDTSSSVRHWKLLSLRDREQPAMARHVMMPDNGYILRPGEFILTHSAEIFNLPLDISCEFKLKSSLARMGINQLTACWCDPGWAGSTITLELTNCLRFHGVHIRPGDKIGQMVFFRHTPVPEEHSYKVRGRYNNDRTVKGIKP